MKKSKLFILLPLVALTLSGCNNTVVSETTSEAPQESETTKESGYSSYTLEFSFYYRGVKESLPSGATIYYAGETNNWSFTPLKESDGSFKLDVGEVEYKTYEYKLLIEYDDKDVDWNTEKVVWPTSGGAANATFTVSETDGGSQSITCSLSTSLEDILTSGEEDTGENSSSETTTGDTSEGGGGTNPSSESGTSEGSSSDSSSGTGGGGDLGGSETFTYSIVLNNPDALQAMEYDAALTEQQGVDLDISLVTTSSTGEVTTKPATYNDVDYSITGDLIIYFNELTVYPQASGETSFTISWPETDATPINVSVKITDVTQEVVTSLNNYTLRFNFTYDSQPDTVPESAELRILGSWDNDDTNTWSNYHVLTAQEDGSYTYTIDKIDVLTEDDAWYTYVLVLGYPDEDWINWDYELTFVEDTYLTFGVTGEEGDNYTNNIALTLSAPMSSIISDLISEYTLTVTIYYEGETPEAETLPSWADLYIAGSWTNWETFEQLTPNEDRTEFTVIIHDVHPGYYNYDLVMSATGTSPSWTNQITNSGDGYFEIISNTTSGSTSYTSSSALETIFPNPDTVTSATNYTVSFTITYNNTANYQLNDYVALYLQGDFDGDGYWEDPMEMNTTDHIIYSYTFETITEVSHQYTVYYNYSGVTLSSDEDWAMKVVEGSDYTFTPNTTTVPIALSINFDINTALADPNQGGNTGDEGGDTGDTGETVSGTSITLYITFQLDGGTEQVLSDSGASLYVIGAWDGNDTNGWKESDAVQLVYTDGKYVAEVSYGNETNVMENHWYGYDVYLVSGTTFSWDDSPILKLNGDEHLWWTYENGSLSKEETITLTDTFANLLAGLADTNTYVDNYTVVFTIKDSNGHVKKCPTGGSLYLGSGLNGSWNPSGWWNWGETYAQLTETVDNEGNVAYSYTADKTAIGVQYEYNIEYAASGSSASWETRLGTDNFTFTTDSVELDNYTGHTQYVTCTATTDVVNSLEDANDYSGETTYEGSVSLYFLIVDTSNVTNASNINGFTINQSLGDGVTDGSIGIFKTNGDSYNWYNYSNATLDTATIGGTTHVYAYNTTVGETSAGTTLYMSINGYNSNQDYYFTCIVPTNCGETITCVLYANLSAFEAYVNDTGVATNEFNTEITSLSYYAGVPSSVVASL